MTDAAVVSQPDAAPSKDDPSKEAQASATIKRYATYGAVTGLIPLPVVDFVVLTGIQVKMISALADIYKVPFSKDAVKSYVVAIIGGIVPVSPIAGTAIHAVRFVPFIGPLMGIAVVPAFAAAMTWAVGRVFATHFHEGRDLLDLDIGAMKEKVKSNLSRTNTAPADAAGAI